MKTRNLVLAMALILSPLLAKSDELKHTIANSSLPQSTETNTRPVAGSVLAAVSQEKVQAGTKESKQAEIQKKVAKARAAKERADKLAAEKKAEEDAKALQQALAEINEPKARRPSPADLGGAAPHR